MNLLTIEQARAHLHDEVSTDLEILDLIFQASAIVMDYLKYEVPDAWKEIDPVRHLPAVPGVVQAATRLVLGELHKEGEAASDPISRGVENLLRRKRDPACQ